MNNKYTKYIIISIVVIIIITLFIVFKINKKTDVVITQTPSNNDRVIPNRSTNTTVDNIKTVNTEVVKPGDEDVIYTKIKKNLTDWEITKDAELLKSSIELSVNADNEIILEAWADFLKNHTDELPKLIDTDIDSMRMKKEVFDIYDWYINLSVQYTELSSSKKQIILNQYKLLK